MAIIPMFESTGASVFFVSEGVVWSSDLELNFSLFTLFSL